MERIMIIGCGGSGKSTLARQLGEKTGLPVIHLDRIFWSPGNWQHLEKAEFDGLLQRELAKPQWIMDGNFNRTMPLRLEKCDTAIYLDYNRFVCIFSWLKRVISNWGKTRPDMGPTATNGWIRNLPNGYGHLIRRTAGNTMKCWHSRKIKRYTSLKTAASYENFCANYKSCII